MWQNCRMKKSTTERASNHCERTASAVNQCGATTDATARAKMQASYEVVTQVCTELRPSGPTHLENRTELACPPTVPCRKASIRSIQAQWRAQEQARGRQSAKGLKEHGSTPSDDFACRWITTRLNKVEMMNSQFGRAAQGRASLIARMAALQTSCQRNPGLPGGLPA